MGSARISRVGFGVIPKQSFDWRHRDWKRDAQRKVRDREARALPFRSEFGSSDDARWDKP